MAVQWIENTTFHTSATLASGMEVIDAVDLAPVLGDLGIARLAITFPIAPTEGQIVVTPYKSGDAGVTYTPEEAMIIPAGKFGDALIVRYYLEDPRTKFAVRNETNQDGTYVGTWSYRVPS